MLGPSGMSDSLQPYRMRPVGHPSPWDFPGKNTGVGCQFVLQGIFLTQGSNPCLLHWQADSLPLYHLGIKDLILSFIHMCIGAQKLSFIFENH